MDAGCRRMGRVIICGVAMIVSGCAVRFSQRSPWDIQALQTLSEQLEQFKTLAQLNAEEADRLRQAKALLEQRLASDINNQDISVGYDERGLVVRVLDRVLFDSGKAALRSEAHRVLAKVARVLKEEVNDQPIGVEGHTDNQPIRQSKWKDNWELSLARAQAVVNDLVHQQGLEPGRFSAIGRGEHQPIASNDTAAGRRQNRRVEIVVLPQGTAMPSSEALSTESGTEAAVRYHK